MKKRLANPLRLLGIKDLFLRKQIQYLLTKPCTRDIMAARLRSTTEQALVPIVRYLMTVKCDDDINFIVDSFVGAENSLLREWWADSGAFIRDGSCAFNGQPFYAGHTQPFPVDDVEAIIGFSAGYEADESFSIFIDLFGVKFSVSMTDKSATNTQPGGSFTAAYYYENALYSYREQILTLRSHTETIGGIPVTLEAQSVVDGDIVSFEADILSPTPFTDLAANTTDSAETLMSYPNKEVLETIELSSVTFVTGSWPYSITVDGDKREFDPTTFVDVAGGVSRRARTKGRYRVVADQTPAFEIDTYSRPPVDLSDYYDDLPDSEYNPAYDVSGVTASNASAKLQEQMNTGFADRVRFYNGLADGVNEIVVESSSRTLTYHLDEVVLDGDTSWRERAYTRPGFTFVSSVLSIPTVVRVSSAPKEQLIFRPLVRAGRVDETITTGYTYSVNNSPMIGSFGVKANRLTGECTVTLSNGVKELFTVNPSRFNTDTVGFGATGISNSDNRILQVRFWKAGNPVPPVKPGYGRYDPRKGEYDYYAE